MEETIEKLKYGNFSGVCLENFVNYFYEDVSCFLDYFDVRNTLLVLDEPGRLMELAGVSELEYRESMEQRLLKGYILPKESKMLYSKDEVMSKVHRCCSCCTTSYMEKKYPFKYCGWYDYIHDIKAEFLCIKSIDIHAKIGTSAAIS